MVVSESVWESRYFDVYDKVLLNSDIYLAVMDFHISAVSGHALVLDSGCGTGNVTIELLKNKHSVHAIDTSRKALGILKNKCSAYSEFLHICNTDVRFMPYKDSMFDAATSMFVVYYINDIETYLKEIYRVLKAGGILVLTGRVSSQNMSDILKSYEVSLEKRGLLPDLACDFNVFKERFQKNVEKAVVSGMTFDQMKCLLESIGFRDVKEFHNPYFGQCYSLVAEK